MAWRNGYLTVSEIIDIDCHGWTLIKRAQAWRLESPADPLNQVDCDSEEAARAEAKASPYDPEEDFR